MATTSSRSFSPRATTALICAVAALATSLLLAPVCWADALGPVPTPVEEASGAVGQTVPPAPEAAAPVTAPVQEVVEEVVPPAANAASPVATPPAHNPSAAPPTAKTPATGGTHSVQAPVETVTHAANEAATSAASSARSVPTVTEPTPTVDPEGAEEIPSEAGATNHASSTAAPNDQPSPSRRTTFVPAPTESGATGAPQPRWVAFVWPAVALLGPRLADFAAEWGQAAAGLAAGASPAPAGSSAAADSSAAAGGVAGVHASGGSDGSSGSSLFDRIPSAVGHQFYPVSTSALLYLALLTVAVIAVAIAVRREIVIGRRR